MVRTFFEAQGAAAAAKFFRGNAERAYKF